MKAGHAPYATALILALMLCSGCTGVHEKQLTQDPVISETEKTASLSASNAGNTRCCIRPIWPMPKPRTWNACG